MAKLLEVATTNTRGGSIVLRQALTQQNRPPVSLKKGGKDNVTVVISSIKEQMGILAKLRTLIG